MNFQFISAWGFVVYGSSDVAGVIMDGSKRAAG